jgi:hypothetical protein
MAKCWSDRANQDQPLMVADGVGELMDEEAKRGALPTSRRPAIGPIKRRELILRPAFAGKVP